MTSHSLKGIEMKLNIKFLAEMLSVSRLCHCEATCFVVSSRELMEESEELQAAPLQGGDTVG